MALMALSQSLLVIASRTFSSISVVVVSVTSGGFSYCPRQAAENPTLSPTASSILKQELVRNEAMMISGGRGVSR